MHLLYTYLLFVYVCAVLVPLLLSLSGRLHFERGQFSCHDPAIQRQYRQSVGDDKRRQQIYLIAQWFFTFLSYFSICTGTRKVVRKEKEFAPKIILGTQRARERERDWKCCCMMKNFPFLHKNIFV